MLGVIDHFREKESRDELGFNVVSSALSDREVVTVVESWWDKYHISIYVARVRGPEIENMVTEALA